VVLDRDVIKHVLRLLLENASKYAPSGLPVAISARCEGQTAIISVKNFGPAIPADEQARIFEKYYRGRGTGTRPRAQVLGWRSQRGLFARKAETSVCTAHRAVVRNFTSPCPSRSVLHESRKNSDHR
jgi:K+-sensing histidine kinase KdpD